ncbi:MAG TPA: type II toxin-antitoxin system RelE/ParE family toxin [Terracidiphilus sp.]|jgi:putative addiction module killer protein|nr:type II toxin-antitoxin system RelE/ParE family toxin [Terracidiphilus sp.]
MLHLSSVIELIRYQQEDGREPYTAWFRSLRDRMAKARIEARLHQIEYGNLGDCKPVGEGVTELRIHVGAGYRVYCGQRGQRIVILLCGGDKDSQARDIARAKVLWADWKLRQP